MSDKRFIKRLRWASEDWPLPLNDAWQSTMCALFGHVPFRDMCGMPAHDACVWCRKSMPGAADSLAKESS